MSEQSAHLDPLQRILVDMATLMERTRNIEESQKDMKQSMFVNQQAVTKAMESLVTKDQLKTQLTTTHRLVYAAGGLVLAGVAIANLVTSYGGT